MITDTNLFNALKKIGSDAAKGGRYFTSFQDDLFVIDRDILVNDSQAGDIYLWVLKSGGCGTWLFRAVGQDLTGLIKPDDRVFKLSCTDINTGTTEEIPFEMAIAFAKQHNESKNRVPRRVKILDAISKHFPSVYNTSIGNCLDLYEGGEKAMLSITFDRYNSIVTFATEKRPDRVLQFRHGLTDVSTTEPLYFACTTKKDGYGSLEATTQRKMASAIKRWQHKARKIAA
tara:strand:+ start:2587 stop:3276 length:690 start_codon:yes stop_codon:yes gene_type:complete